MGSPDLARGRSLLTAALGFSLLDTQGQEQPACRRFVAKELHVGMRHGFFSSSI